MEFKEILDHLWSSLKGILPRAMGALIVLGVGWITGRLLGRVVSTIIRRSKIDASFGRTLIGKTLERSGWSLSFFFDMVVRWFVYIGSFLVAVDILGIEILEPFTTMTIQYLPTVIGGFFIFIMGVVFVDFLADLAMTYSKELKIEYIGFFILSLRLFMYFVVTTVTLTVMKIDVSILYSFANALAWGVAAGIAVGLGIALGWGFKDTIAKNAEKWTMATRTTVEKVEEVEKEAELEALRKRVEELESSLAEQKEMFTGLVKIRASMIEELTTPVEEGLAQNP